MSIIIRRAKPLSPWTGSICCWAPGSHTHQIQDKPPLELQVCSFVPCSHILMPLRISAKVSQIMCALPVLQVPLIHTTHGREHVGFFLLRYRIYALEWKYIYMYRMKDSYEENSIKTITHVEKQNHANSSCNPWWLFFIILFLLFSKWYYPGFFVTIMSVPDVYSPISMF